MLLPFQFAWNVAAAYCAHEKGAAAQHVGHHTHVHTAGEVIDADQKPGTLSPADADCATCHLSGMTLPPDVLELIPHAPRAAPLDLHAWPRLPAIADVPERPDWLRAA